MLNQQVERNRPLYLNFFFCIVSIGALAFVGKKIYERSKNNSIKGVKPINQNNSKSIEREYNSQDFQPNSKNENLETQEVENDQETYKYNNQEKNSDLNDKNKSSVNNVFHEIKTTKETENKAKDDWFPKYILSSKEIMYKFGKIILSLGLCYAAVYGISIAASSFFFSQKQPSSPSLNTNKLPISQNTNHYKFPQLYKDIEYVMPALGEASKTEYDFMSALEEASKAEFSKFDTTLKKWEFKPWGIELS